MKDLQQLEERERYFTDSLLGFILSVLMIVGLRFLVCIFH